MQGNSIGFWILAALCIFAAVQVVANRNPVRSALALVGVMCCLSVFYFAQGAEFVGAVQLIVYAGAIMVLFLFVIMLLNLGAPNPMMDRVGLSKPVALLASAALLGSLALAGALKMAPDRVGKSPVSGTVQQIGYALFDPGRPWLFAFELTSVLLLVGVVGAVVLAQRRSD
jgi:NADH-quinone oxidoreductase subunit J